MHQYRIKEFGTTPHGSQGYDTRLVDSQPQPH